MESVDENKLPITEHLEELRKRLIYCVIALVIAMIPSAFFANNVFELMLGIAPAGFKPVYTEMAEMLFTYFKVALISGACLAMPVFVYQVIRFVAPALTRSEKRSLFLSMPGVIIFFVAGLAFSYYVLLPFAINYLLTFSGVADPMIKIGNYMSFVVTILIGMGVAFQTPMIMFILAKLGVVDAKQLGSFRKYAILVVFLVAAVITPTPDPLNQVLTAVPLYLLFEIGVLMARVA